MTQSTDGITKATFTKQGGSSSRGNAITVDFNPESLKYVITNTLSDRRNRRRGQSQQYVSKSSGKLTMELVFDTTDTGEDVREKTTVVSKFLEPGRDDTPPQVRFEWGTYSFTGMFEKYQETMDFFAETGVPLRATLSVTMTSQENLFDGSQSANSQSDEDETAETTPPSGIGATGAATAAGDPNAGRDIAAANGSENMRFPSEPLEVSGSPQLQAPAAFATGASFGAGAGAGVSAGAGLNASAGLGIGGGFGAGLDLSAGIEAGAGLGASFDASIDLDIDMEVSANASMSASIGANASAGLSASGGAFAGLHTATTKSSKKLSLEAFTENTTSSAVGLNASAAIGIGGAANLNGSASMTADVGSPGQFKARIEFE